jgi:thiamine biosynthesis protein ThiS
MTGDGSSKTQVPSSKKAPNAEGGKSQCQSIGICPHCNLRVFWSLYFGFCDLRILHAVITVTVNGQPRQLDEATTLRQLVAQFNLTPDKVAIELNRRLVRSEKYDTQLKAGDEVEIVTFVGGG